MPHQQVRLDQREVGEVPGRGVLELAEGNEVGGEPVVQPGPVDEAGQRGAAVSPSTYTFHVRPWASSRSKIVSAVLSP